MRAGLLEQSRSASGSEVPGGFIQLNLFKEACAMTVAIIIAAHHSSNLRHK